MEVQIKSQIFDHAGPISIHRFLPALKTTCDADIIHEGAAMWLFQHFVNKTTEATISAKTTSIDKKLRGKDGQVTSYEMVVNNLLRTYATDEIVSYNDTNINRSK